MGPPLHKTYVFLPETGKAGETCSESAKAGETCSSVVGCDLAGATTKQSQMQQQSAKAKASNEHASNASTLRLKIIA
jgi:hypothetical protein